MTRSLAAGVGGPSNGSGAGWRKAWMGGGDGLIAIMAIKRR